LHRVLEEHLYDDFMHNTPVEEGIRRIVQLTKEKLPKAPQPKPITGFEHGMELRAPEEERGPGLAGAIRRRREHLRASRFEES
jgi:hypothetical protein